jgi:hypothetical protein
VYKDGISYPADLRIDRGPGHRSIVLSPISEWSRLLFEVVIYSIFAEYGHAQAMGWRTGISI